MDEKFWSNCKEQGECLIWTGHINEDGYGQLKRNYKTYRAHRYAWELINGTIPQGMLVCHVCDNRKCANPDHLFLGTYKDNMQDASRKGRLNHKNQRKGSQCKQAKLNESQVLVIRQRLVSESISSIAKEYQISVRAIRRIKDRHSWKHI